MPKPTATIEKWLTPKEVEALTGIPTWRLARMRIQKVGPPFKKLGGKGPCGVVYVESDIANWQAQQTRIETADSYEAQKAS